MVDNPLSYTGDGDKEWGLLRRAYNAVLHGLRVVIHGFDGSSYPAVSTDANGHLNVNVMGGSGSGTEFTDGDAIDTDSRGTLAIGTTGVSGTAKALRTNASGQLQVEVQGTVPVSGTVTITDGSGPVTVDGTVAVSSVGGTVTVSGTVTANAGTGTFAVADSAAEASLSVLDDWDESDRAKVNPIVGQAGVQGGAGASTALTQRVALATDANTIQGTVTASNTTGNVAADGATTGNPVQIAYEADDTEKSAMSAAGDVVRPWADLRGRLVVRADYPGDITLKRTALTSTSAETAVTDDPGSTGAIVVYSIFATNKSTTGTLVDFRDDASSTIIASIYLLPGGSGEVPTGGPVRLTADNALTAQCASVDSVYITIGYKTVTL